MPEKQKSRTWKDPKTVIAAVSVTALLTLWNAFASNDRQSTGETSSDLFMSTPFPAATPQTVSEQIAVRRLKPKIWERGVCR